MIIAKTAGELADIISTYPRDTVIYVETTDDPEDNTALMGSVDLPHTKFRILCMLTNFVHADFSGRANDDKQE